MPSNISRPVNVSPLQAAFPIVDPKTGRATETFQRYLLRMWERTGGFSDEFFELLTVANLGTIQGLIATGQNEALARALGDVAAQGKLNQIDKLAAQLESLQRQFNTLQGVSTSALAPVGRTRLITLEADDTYYVGADVKALEVFVLGGGGGGGNGSLGAGAGGSGGGGGGGGGFSYTYLNPLYLPNTIAVTVGAGGLGGAGTFSGAGDPGGASSFGPYVYANGGNGGALGGVATGAGGAATTAYGNLYRGGAGGTGQLANGDSALNDQLGAPGGGGGGGYNNGSGGAGAAGASRATTSSGGGGAGGAAASTGDPGASVGDSNVYLAPGWGGGGGGGGLVDAGGNGGDGVIGAGGGGGGGAVTLGTVGAGGNGGDGRVWIVEHL